MYINDKRKFNLIVYNKKIKLKLGLNLTDFIRISGKYKKELIIIMKNYYIEDIIQRIKKMEEEKNIMKKVI